MRLHRFDSRAGRVHADGRRIPVPFGYARARVRVDRVVEPLRLRQACPVAAFRKGHHLLPKRRGLRGDGEVVECWMC